MAPAPERFPVRCPATVASLGYQRPLFDPCASLPPGLTTVDCPPRGATETGASLINLTSTGPGGASPFVYLFIVALPWTGTSALHFLLTTSPAVTSVADEGTGVSSAKEGWELSLTVNGTATTAKAWRRGGGPVPWNELVAEYHRRWDPSKPVRLEVTPEEFPYAKRLRALFEPRGPVRFLFLARSPCTSRKPEERLQQAWLPQVHKYMPYLKEFRETSFFLRYEDLCARPVAVRDALLRWLPELGSLDLLRSPRAPSTRGARPVAEDSVADTSAGHHQLSLPTHCWLNEIPFWPVRREVRLSRAEVAAYRAMGYALQPVTAGGKGGKGKGTGKGKGKGKGKGAGTADGKRWGHGKGWGQPRARAG